MYGRIVAGRVRGVFAELSRGNWAVMVDGLAEQFDYRFYGENALSGERRTKSAMRAWWQRCFRLLPDPRFAVEELLVSGPPWNTRVATAVRITATLPDGSGYDNIVHQFIRLRWGRVTKVRTLEDTVVLQRALDICAAHGMAEAHGEPIVDSVAASA